MRKDAERAVSCQETSSADEVQFRRDAAVRGTLAGRQPESVATAGLVHRRSVLDVLTVTQSSNELL